MRFQVGRLIGDIPIGGRMSFIETIIGKGNNLIGYYTDDGFVDAVDYPFGNEFLYGGVNLLNFLLAALS